MKNIFLLLIAIFTLNGCEDDNSKPKTELEKLPATTQTGANTIGCLVNGKAFIPKGYMFTKGCFYENGLNFGLSVSMDTNNGGKTVNMGCLNTHLEEGETYQLREKGPDLQFGEYVIETPPPTNPNNYYSTTSTVIGELKITRHDFDHAFLSGTFWFDAVNSNGEKVEVREGRFDMHYTD